MQRAFRYRFYPTPEQESLLRRTLGCVRLVYNKALDARSTAWSQEQRSISYVESSAMLTSWKKYPDFKKKSQGGSAEFTKSGFRFKDGQVFLAKCSEPLPIRWSRQLPGSATPSSVTVSLSPSGRWHVSVLVDDHTVKPLPEKTNQVGIDLGLTSLMADSNGKKIRNPRHFNKLHKKLKKLQQRLSKKVKDSKNRIKARIQAARVYEKISNTRRDLLHKLSTKLIRENRVIVVEDLCIKGMLRSKRYSRSIADASWGEFVRQLEYRAEWRGRSLVKIDRFFPSTRTCSTCGHLGSRLPETIRDWKCPNCGAQHDRDVNAAKNILAAGLAVTACGATVRPNSPEERGRCIEAGRSRS